MIQNELKMMTKVFSVLVLTILATVISLGQGALKEGDCEGNEILGSKIHRFY
jgi:hypothetical protein